MPSVRRMFPQQWQLPIDIPYFLLLNQQPIARYTCILLDKSITNNHINHQISSSQSNEQSHTTNDNRSDERNAHLRDPLLLSYGVLDQIGEPRKTHK